VKRVLSILIILALSAAAFSFFEVDRQPKIEATVSISDSANGLEEKAIEWPIDDEQYISVSGENPKHLRIEIEPNGYNLLGTLSFSYAKSGINLLIIGQDAHESRMRCKLPKDITDAICRAPIKVEKDSQITLLFNSDDTKHATISNIDITFSTAKRQIEADHSRLLLIFIILALLGPLIAYLQRYRTTQSLFLIILGLCWLIYVSPQGAALFTGFLSFGYVLIAGLQNQAAKSANKLICIIALIILCLLFFKFGAPLILSAFANPGGLSLALPIGISYLAIRLIDLCLSAYSNALKDLNFIRYCTFMALPHTLLAGPIFTYENFNKSQNGNYSIVDFSAGAGRITLGLAKKFFADLYVLQLVASNMSIFMLGNEELSYSQLWIMLLANVLYIYLDFSAYCDLAIGSGRMANIQVPENFNLPLLKSGIMDYWRNWHMTLSNWVMRRVYFPVFISTRSPYVSTFACMLAIGLWHTPNLSWAAWAVHHSTAMYLQQKLVKKLKSNSRWQMLNEYKSFRWGLYCFGVFFVWVWVALGQTFTLFTDTSDAFSLYLRALSLSYL